MAKEMTASVLAFEKKLVPSDGYLYGTSWETRKEHAKKLALNEKSVRGTISNRLNKKLMADPAKLDAEIEKANLQVVDNCSLDINQDTLKVQFSLKVLGNVGIPSACNNHDVLKNLLIMSSAYAQKEGFRELGKRYAMNIANGRFLWRNRVGAEKIEVHVGLPTLKESWTFDALELPLQDFDSKDPQVVSLGQRIAEALSGDATHFTFEIEAFSKLGTAQEVYPSEELVLGKQKADKSKILYQVEGHAALHSQKIGNALRSIDTWYPEYSEALVGPIAIEPYGAVTNLGKAFRTPKNKTDFYSLFDQYACGQTLSSIEEEHYVLAVLVRGGVFGASDKE